MDQRVSLITLGVADMDAAATFYEALGWTRVESQDGVVAFDLIGQTLGLYLRAALAADLGIAVEDIGGFSGVTFGYNVPNKEDVAPLLELAKQAGGKVLKPAQDVFWGGHHGFFCRSRWPRLGGRA